MGDGRLLIVEPHSDDAWLSLGGHIEKWIKEKRQVHIVTVYGEPDANGARWMEAAKYARAMGAGWTGLGYWETGQGIAGTHTEAVHRLENMDLVEDMVRRGWQAVFPLGLRHPEHLEVARVADRFGAWRYLEQPYAAKCLNSAEVTLKLQGRSVISYLRPKKNKLRHHVIFQTQRRFWFQEESNMVNATEMIVGHR